MNIRCTVIYSLLNINAIVMSSNLSEWTLVWNDEFNGDQIDSSKWNVANERNFCHGSYNQQLQCHTSNNKNIQQSNGVLAIAAVKEKRLNKEFTSGMISTKLGFTYCKVEIRASLPNGKMLRPAIWMYPQNASNEWPKSGQIDVMTNIQYPLIASGIHYVDGSARYLGNNDDEYGLNDNSTLNDYHIYELEWTPDYIKWLFDGYIYFSVNINRKFGPIYSQNGQPFDHNFKIFIHLGIGGIFFPNIALTEQDVIDWNCSLFILDYVRIYQLINTTNNIRDNLIDLPLNTSSTPVNGVCSNIMPKIRPAKNETIDTLSNFRSNNGSTNYIWLTVLINVILVLLLVLIFICWRGIVNRRKHRKQIDVKGETKLNSLHENYYADVDVKYEDENYETINDNYYEMVANVDINDYDVIDQNCEMVDKSYTTIL